MVKRLLLAVACCSLLLPAAADAHAILDSTAPQRGEVLAEQPEQVAFYFSEPVETAFGAVRVFNSSGEEVQSGEALRPGDDGTGVAVALEPDLPDGTYTAVYRVISADSHPVSGGFVFSIGKPDQGGESVGKLLGNDSGPGTQSVVAIEVRWMGYVSTALLIGGLLFLLVVWRPSIAGSAVAPSAHLEASRAFEDRLRHIVGLAAVAGLLAALLALPLQAATAADVPLYRGFDPDLLTELLDTRFGAVGAIRALAWLLLAMVVWLAPRSIWNKPGLLAASLSVPALLLVLAPGLAGHASTQDPTAVLLPADLIHMAGMSVWLGGLAVLLFALPAATRQFEPAARSDLLSRCLTRFSPLAVASVIALALTGTIQAIIEVGSFADLFETGFGRVVLVKVALLLLLIGLGWANRNRLMPAIRSLAASRRTLDEVGRRLRTNLRIEIAAIAAVLVASSLLVGFAPPSDSVAGPISGASTLGDAYLEYTVEPATIGANQLHLYLFDADDGSQLDVEEVTAESSLPELDVGPIDVDLRKAGPGHYVAPAADFGIAGDWVLGVTARTSRFEQDATEVVIPID